MKTLHHLIFASLFLPGCWTAEVFGQVECSAPGNLRGIRVDGELMAFSTSIRAVVPTATEEGQGGRGRGGGQFSRDSGALIVNGSLTGGGGGRGGGPGGGGRGRGRGGAPLTEDEAATLKASVTSETAAAAIVEAAEVSRTTAIEFFQTPAELGERFHVPQLALRVLGELALFDDPEVLEYPWDLSPYDAAPTSDDLSALGAGLKASEGGEIDVDDASGKVVSRFLPDLQRDLGLVYQAENWDEIRLATWLCRNLPEQSLTHASKLAFVAAWLTDPLRREGFALARANLQKFLLRNRLEARIRDLRKQAVGKAYQQTLFGDDAASRVTVSDRYAFDFHPQAYAPSRDYDGRFGRFDFRKHFYGRIGDFDSKEEFDCACWLDIQAQQGRIQFWVRNLVRREGSSFFLQKADGRFYPDFLCQLPGKDGNPGPILAVEYKGADRWLSAEDDRLIGGLWAGLSEGRCRFVMVKDKRWEWVEEHLT